VFGERLGLGPGGVLMTREQELVVAEFSQPNLGTPRRRGDEAALAELS
jgi:hypothetical protein